MEPCTKHVPRLDQRLSTLPMTMTHASRGQFRASEERDFVPGRRWGWE